MQKEGEIVMDSGAAENVMPKSWLPEAEEIERQRGIKFIAANGIEMGNNGRKVVEFEPVHCEEDEEAQVFRRQD